MKDLERRIQEVYKFWRRQGKIFDETDPEIRECAIDMAGAVKDLEHDPTNEVTLQSLNGPNFTVFSTMTSSEELQNNVLGLINQNTDGKHCPQCGRLQWDEHKPCEPCENDFDHICPHLDDHGECDACEECEELTKHP